MTWRETSQRLARLWRESKNSATTLARFRDSRHFTASSDQSLRFRDMACDKNKILILQNQSVVIILDNRAWMRKSLHLAVSAPAVNG